ncbi:TlpA disulfide reductase family protein [Robertkochia solimangrovi]|uniref:TlpA disulfide reductase family protein n=1 Tax=Robertkochia solimangrovi TaxID=2213046 RepID=UPI00117FC64A|nr:TlpA disulfide reductase family protein [Robertkochia solimangrovi]TRZ45740.1 hypothetical protein DMZ48_00210 [Robertkochia solimangrovi]
MNQKTTPYIPYWILIQILSLSLLFSGCKRKEDQALKNQNFTVIGNVKNLNSEYLIYSEDFNSKTGNRIYDTLWIKNGKFQFQDSIANFKYYRIFARQTEKTISRVDEKSHSYLPTPVSWFHFIGYPGATIKLEGQITDFVDAYPNDGGINDSLGKLNRRIFPLLDTIVNLKQQYYLNNSDPETYHEISKISDAIMKEIRAEKERFIVSQPDSPVAAFVLLDAFTRSEFNDAEFNRLYEKLDSIALKDVSFFEDLRVRYLAIENIKIGKIIPDFTSPDTPDSTLFNIRELRGYYVLVDFWGIWCSPCTDELPQIKSYYEKYKDKGLTILGINSGDTRAKWQDYIYSNEYNWHHIQSDKLQNDLITQLNVRYFPTKFLIDPEGRIIFSSEQSRQTIFEVMDEIFSDK